MSRSTRHDRAMPMQKRRATKQQKIQALTREIRRRLISAGVMPNPADARPKFDWHWASSNGGGVVEANTRSEARGLIMRMLGVKKLPKDTEIVRVQPDATPTNSTPAASLSPVSA